MSFNTAKVVVLLNVVRLCILVWLDHAYDGRCPAGCSLLLLHCGKETSQGIAFWRILNDLTIDLLHESVGHPLVERLSETVIRIESDS